MSCTPITRALPAAALALLAGFALSVPSAHAVTVSVSPSDTTVVLGTTFTLTSEVDAFPDLKAYEVIYDFDPTVVQLLGASPGSVLTGTGNPYSAFLVSDYTAPPDTAWYDAACLNGSTAGPGSLVSFQFKALNLGVTTVRCRLVDFRDSNNVRTLPLCNDGRVRVIGSTHVGVVSWGKVRRIYRR